MKWMRHQFLFLAFVWSVGAVACLVPAAPATALPVSIEAQYLDGTTGQWTSVEHSYRSADTRRGGIYSFALPVIAKDGNSITGLDRQKATTVSLSFRDSPHPSIFDPNGWIIDIRRPSCNPDAYDCRNAPLHHQHGTPNAQRLRLNFSEGTAMTIANADTVVNFLNITWSASGTSLIGSLPGSWDPKYNMSEFQLVTTPLPAAIGPFIAGLAGLGFVARRHRVRRRGPAS